MEAKRIPGYPDYAVTRSGEVLSFKAKKPRKLRPRTMSRGHQNVILQLDGHGVSRLVHRLVLLAFVGPPPEGMECRHLNGKAKDNRLENLCWGSRSENLLDSVRHGTHQTSRLTNKQIRQIRNMSGRYEDIGGQFGISISHVFRIKSGQIGNYSLRVRGD